MACVRGHRNSTPNSYLNVTAFEGARPSLVAPHRWGYAFVSPLTQPHPHRRRTPTTPRPPMRMANGFIYAILHAQLQLVQHVYTRALLSADGTYICFCGRVRSRQRDAHAPLERHRIVKTGRAGRWILRKVQAPVSSFSRAAGACRTARDRII